MNKTSLSKQRPHLISLAVVALSAQVHAQTNTATSDGKLERVEITGSMIKRLDAESPAPVSVISREEILRSGANSVEELLRGSSAVGPGGQQDLSSGNGWAGGTGSVSLRGMGSAATLTLINGRRLAPAAVVDPNTGQSTIFNVNAIPMSAIDHIEILKDGASSLYGSDAIAGVVNIILRRDYQGRNLSVSASQRSDGLFKTQTVNGMWGFGDQAKDGFNVMAGLDIYRRDAVSIVENPNLVDQSTYGSLYSRLALSSTYSNPGNFYTYKNGSTGSFMGQNSGCATENQVAVSSSNAALACKYVTYGENYFYVGKQDRTGGLLRATLDLPKGATLTGELLASRSQSTYYSNPATIGETSTTWGDSKGNSITYKGLVLPGTHADNPTKNATSTNPVFGYTAPTALGLRYRFTDIPRYQLETADNIRAVLNAEFEWKGWDWNAGLLHHWQRNVQERHGMISVSALNAAVADGSYHFGGTNTADVLAALSPTVERKGSAQTTALDLRGSRELFKLDGGMAMLGVGSELRSERFTLSADSRVAAGDIYGLGISEADGSRRVAAAYAELQAPLVKDLETQAALRVENYSDFGTALTGKLGTKYKLAPNAAVRATLSNGFRAPSLSQITKSSVFAFTTVQDKVLCPVYSSSNENCAISISSVIQANPDLKPEKSTTATAGLMFSPVSGTDAMLDFFFIERRNEVDRLSAQSVVNREAEFSTKVIRASTTDGTVGRITQVIRQYRNMSLTQTSGLDFELTQSLSLAAGHKLKLSAGGTRTFKYVSQTEAGTAKYDSIGYYERPRIKSFVSANYNWADWSGTLRFNYLGTMKSYSYGYSCDSTATAAGRTDLCTLPEYITADLSVVYTGVRGLRLSAMIKNLADKRPPTDVNYYDTGYNPGLYDVKGRYFTLSASYDF